jgi:2-oxoglutarate ferredoxin oxidoreductase subunit gamma
MRKKNVVTQPTSFFFAGFGGQGVLAMGMMLTYAGMQENKQVTWIPSYGAQMRGGTANCTVIIADDDIASPVVAQADVVVVMNQPALAKFTHMVKKGGFLFINSSLVTNQSHRRDITIINIPATQIADELGNPRVANMVMLGSVVTTTRIVKLTTIKQAILPVIGEDKRPLLKLNHQALNMGASFS